MKRKTRCLVVMLLALSLVSGTVIPTMPAKVQAATTKKAQNKKALKAYKKMLSRKKLTWGSGKADLTVNMRFALVDVNKDGVKELLLINDESCYAAGYFRLYSYVNGKVKLITSINNRPVFYQNKLMRIDFVHTGGFATSYYKYKKNDLKCILSMSGMGSKEVIPEDVKKIVKKKYNGMDVYYFDFSINNKECTYAKYKARLNQLTQGVEKVKYKFNKNTKANRSKWFK